MGFQSPYLYERARQASIVDSWRFRWFGVWLLSAIAFGALDDRNIGWVDSIVLPVLFLVAYIARFVLLFLFLRFLWRTLLWAVGLAAACMSP